MEMVNIRFWDSADECIMVNGLYSHKVAESIAEICIQAVLPTAIECGAVSVTIDNDVYMKDYSICTDENGNIYTEINFVDEYETVEDDYESNMYCDSYGVCGGNTCPQYRDCFGMMRGIL